MRNLFFLAAFVAGTGCLTAQTEKINVIVEESTDKYKVETNRFWSNWFITAGGGVQMYLGDHNRQQSIGKQLTPAMEFAVGKWFTPGIGVRLMANGMTVKGLTQNGAHSTGKIHDVSKSLYNQEFDFLDVHGDVMFNLTNIFCGYNPDRVYSFIPYAGVGLIMNFDSPKAQSVSANVGIINTFRLSPALDLNVDIRGSMLDDRFDGEIGGRSFEGLFSTTVGLTYKFKQRGWNRTTKVKEIYYDEDKLNEMRNRLNQCQSTLKDVSDENIQLKNQLANVSDKVTEKVVLPQQAIFFGLGQATLNKQSRVNLGFLAKAIMDSNVKTFVITGYADKATGSTSTNSALSKARAEAVYNCLVNEYKVPASLLVVKSDGGVANLFFDDNSLSRVVITESNE